MLKKNTVFSRLYLSYSLIIVTSLLLFMSVYFYLYHINLYKEFEGVYFHHYNQLEEQLQSMDNLDLRITKRRKD